MTRIRMRMRHSSLASNKGDEVMSDDVSLKALIPSGSSVVITSSPHHLITLVPPSENRDWYTARV